MKFFLTGLFITLNFLVFAQSDFNKLEHELAFHADVMVNASKSTHREKASKAFKELFINSLNEEGSYNYPFDSLVWISKLEPVDSSFRIFTWQMVYNNDSVAYYGVFQTADSRLIILDDNYALNQDFIYDQLSSKNWYGQLYHDIQVFEFNEKKQYLLFGARIVDQNTYQKIVEPLIWDGEDLFFGDEVFFNKGRHGAFRISSAYFAQAKVNVLYDNELNMIVYDHLIPVINPYESNETIMVPDGTLEGYSFVEGKWTYKDRIFTESYTDPPIPQPKVKDGDKDIFGK